jgi:hypothetical protein
MMDENSSIASNTLNLDSRKYGVMPSANTFNDTSNWTRKQVHSEPPAVTSRHEPQNSNAPRIRRTSPAARCSAPSMHWTACCRSPTAAATTDTRRTFATPPRGAPTTQAAAQRVNHAQHSTEIPRTSTVQDTMHSTRVLRTHTMHSTRTTLARTTTSKQAITAGRRSTPSTTSRTSSTRSRHVAGFASTLCTTSTTGDTAAPTPCDAAATPTHTHTRRVDQGLAAPAPWGRVTGWRSVRVGV